MAFATLTSAAFEERVRQAKDGDRIVYHVGFLLADRTCGEDFLKVNGVATAAMAACEAGKVHLVQRYLAPMVYECIAIKRPAPYQRVKWTGCYDPHRQSMAKEPEAA